MPTLTTVHGPSRVTPKKPVMTGWAAAVAKTPAKLMEERKLEFQSMQEEIAQLKAQIAAAKKATGPVDVKTEVSDLRNFMDDSDSDSDIQSMNWGDLVDEEYGLE